jgi:hypothetical protein
MAATVAPNENDAATRRFQFSNNNPNNHHLGKPTNSRLLERPSDLPFRLDREGIKLEPRWLSLAFRPGTPPKIIR